MMNKRTKQFFSTVVVGVISISIGLAQSIQEGLDHLNADRVKVAGEIFTKLAESSPSAENLFYLGYYNLKTDKLDQAAAAFEKGLQLEPKDMLNVVGQGAVALGKGDRTKATELFQLAEKKKKKDAGILFRIGEAYTLFEDNNDPAEAIRLLDEAIKRDKDIADAYLAKGDALMIKNEGGAAVTAYEYALSAKPNYPLANNRIGQVYLRGKNYNEALNYYRKAIEADPEFSPAYRDLAELYFFARQFKRAAENMDMYIQKSQTTDPEMTLRAAQLIFTADDYTRALQLLDSLQGKLDNPMMLRMYGWSYFKTNEMDKAIESLNKFIEVAPEKIISDDYKFLGRAYNKLATDGKEYDEKGMEYLVKAAELDTSEAEAAVTYKEIAGLYNKEKEYEKAIEAYEKGIQLDTVKASTQDYYALGIAYLQSGIAVTVPDSASADSTELADTRRDFFLRSDSTFAILAQKIPDWPFSYYWRGSSLYYINSVENIEKGISLPHYEKFIELGANDSNVNKSFLIRAYNYVAAYYQTTGNDAEKAKPYWEKILELDPDNAAAKSALTPVDSSAAATTP